MNQKTYLLNSNKNYEPKFLNTQGGHQSKYEQVNYLSNYRNYLRHKEHS